MVTTTYSVTHEGLEATLVQVQCTASQGIPAFAMVGLADKAVSEARERVRSALSSLSVALPSRKVIFNLSPADLPKNGAHFDLSLAVALLVEMGIIPSDKAEQTIVIGELSLDGRLLPVTGALPAALTAAQYGKALLCPLACADEAAWIGSTTVFGASTLLEVLNHFSGQAPLQPHRGMRPQTTRTALDLADVKGQTLAKRALEIAAAGRHHMLMVGPPGVGKSMLASRLPSLLPPLTPHEALETAIARSMAGQTPQQIMDLTPPYRAPHSSSTMPALIGGGRKAVPGEISLAHNGVLFMDEMPEFSREVLESLRQPLETGRIQLSRAHARTSYPCRFLLIAAANPCRCGYMSDPARACGSAPRCGETYMEKLSGPLLDRFDVHINMLPLELSDYESPPPAESSATIAMRVLQARKAQEARFAQNSIKLNSQAEGNLLEEIAQPDSQGRTLLLKAVDRFGLSARGYHRSLRVARTIADLDQSQQVRLPHIAEALGYRQNIQRLRRR